MTFYINNSLIYDQYMDHKLVTNRLLTRGIEHQGNKSEKPARDLLQPRAGFIRTIADASGIPRQLSFPYGFSL